MTTEERAKSFKKEWKEVCELRGPSYSATSGMPDVADLLPLLDAAVADEREACAKIADALAESEGNATARMVAALIRARK